MLLFPRITESLGKGAYAMSRTAHGLLRYYHRGRRLEGTAGDAPDA
jgi:hypothetical protein